MTDSKIKIGIIGAGRMGVTHHSIINSRDDVEVVATADPSVVMNKLLSKYAGVNTYKNYAAMLKKEKLDAVFVCTPPAHNEEILRAVHAAGLHAFVEKPFLLSGTLGMELAELFDKAGLVNQVGYVNRFNDVFKRVKSFMTEGLIGEAVRFRSEMYSATIVGEQDEDSWRSTHANGGGATYEMASHAIDLITFLFGKPDNISGTRLTKVYSKNVDDIVSSNFAYKSGVDGSIYVNWSDSSFRKPTNKLEVFGTKGKIQADQHSMKIFLQEANEKHGLNAGWNTLYITDLFSNVPFYLRGIEFTAQLYDFVDCIKEGRSQSQCDFAQGSSALLVIDQMFADHAKTESELQR